jgi:hypothetical protein
MGMLPFGALHVWLNWGEGMGRRALRHAGFQEQAYILAFAYADLASGLPAITSDQHRLITTLYGGIGKDADRFGGLVERPRFSTQGMKNSTDSLLRLSAEASSQELPGSPRSNSTIATTSTSFATQAERRQRRVGMERLFFWAKEL